MRHPHGTGIIRICWPSVLSVCLPPCQFAIALPKRGNLLCTFSTSNNQWVQPWLFLFSLTVRIFIKQLCFITRDFDSPSYTSPINSSISHTHKSFDSNRRQNIAGYHSRKAACTSIKVLTELLNQSLKETKWGLYPSAPPHVLTECWIHFALFLMLRLKIMISLQQHTENERNCGGCKLTTEELTKAIMNNKK